MTTREGEAMRPNSLVSVDADLAARLDRASESELRAAALAACQFALARVPVTDSVIEEGLTALQQHRYGDQDGLRTRIEAVVTGYDEQQWALQDAGRGDDPAYFDAFEKARAANTLYYALDTDPWLASTRAIYDAEAATDDLTALKGEVLTALHAAT